jgi:2-dehydro-3-deoxyphosphooctonate aldolase (KDO 8-P synthase)
MIPETKPYKIGPIAVGGRSPFFLIAGPCIAESRDLLFEVGRKMSKVCQELGIPYIFKTSYDKANRSSVTGYRGPGIETTIKWLEELKSELGVPILTDVHDPKDCAMAASVADILQIPAFLCRQTDLIRSAAETSRALNIKKGQFMSPFEVKNIVQKAEAFGNSRVSITERGFSFGYNNLVVDQRSFPIIRSLGIPVVFDATHSVQLPGGLGSSTGGQREFIPNLSRAAVANGIDGLFMEVHPEPEKGLSDPTTMYPLDQAPKLLSTLKKLDLLVKSPN